LIFDITQVISLISDFLRKTMWRLLLLQL